MKVWPREADLLNGGSIGRALVRSVGTFDRVRLDVWRRLAGRRGSAGAVERYPLHKWLVGLPVNAGKLDSISQLKAKKDYIPYL